MEDNRPSTTALVTARMRAIHTLSDPNPLFNDPWGSKLAPASVLAPAMSAEELAPMSDSEAEELIDPVLRASPAYANVIVRTRYTEDALGSAISEGVGQYVIIGAGYDSYALRRPREAQGLEIFEIDHPATQAIKKLRLAELGVKNDDKVHFIAADLGKETIESALTRSSFDSTKKSFLSWLGVTMYLTREANMAALASVAKCCAPGSLLVFSYIDQAVFEPGYSGNVEAVTDLKRTVQTMGEPFISGFHSDALENELSNTGFHLEENIADIRNLQRCDPSGTNGLKSSGMGHIARVRVMEK